MKKIIYILLIIEFIILDIFCFLEIISGNAYTNEGWFFLISTLFTAILLFTIPKLWIENILDYEPAKNTFITIIEILLYSTPIILFVFILLEYKTIMIYDIKCILFIFTLVLAPIFELSRHKIENNYTRNQKQKEEPKTDILKKEYTEKEKQQIQKDEIIQIIEEHEKEKNIKLNKEILKENIFYNEQLNKCTNCEKEYYKVLYELYGDKYNIETQVYLRSMFHKMGAPNHKIDMVMIEKDTDNITLLIEINDSTHKNKLRVLRDKELKEFCNQNHIPLQTLYTKYDCIKSSIKKVIDKKLAE